MCGSDVPPEIIAALSGLEEHYTDLQEIKRGASGYLFFARNRISNASVAIKFYGGLPGDGRHDEPRKLSAITSPNVLPILDARNVSDEWAYFVTPRCTGGDIDDFIGTRPSVHGALDIALGACAGVSAIHAQHMVHRDLKPGNIVIDEGTPRIADFGSVKALLSGETETTASQHSVLYRPPESFTTHRYSVKGDVYQLGLLVYQLFGGTLPYDGRSYLTPKERKIYDAIRDQVDQSIFVDDAIRRRAQAGKLIAMDSLPPWITGAARRAIREMICPNPAERCSCVADVAAHLSRLRPVLADWRWNGTCARVSVGGKVIELRPIGGGLYEAYQQGINRFRRAAGFGAATLSILVKMISG